MAIDRREITPEGYLFDYEWEDEKITCRFSQPRSYYTKLHNAELRKHDVPRETAMGRPALSLDEVDRYTIAKLFPGINSFDPQERSQAWKTFIKSPLSEPYRVIRNVS